MRIPSQLAKIESQIQAFTMTDNVENLIMASEYLRDLISHIQKAEIKESAKNFRKKLKLLLTK